MQAPIILASSSAFRKSLLERLHLPFECHSPEVDESLLPGESASSYVCRLAEAKAQAVADKYPGAVIIGSDQCALLDDEILGKPGNHENALRQLKAAQGKTVVFHTGICVFQQATGFTEVDDILFQVKFRQLSDTQLEHYLQTEQPYQCAGAFKSEGYGVSLFNQMQGDDPTALIGLPLIRLTSMLEQAGIKVI
ncbi:MAG: nucleoside triphosphate pyrophosphatase [Gammaproteobacteria bacterium]